MNQPRGIERLLDVVARLRGEGGCPWDREQTLETLKPYLVEECYEVLDAVDSGEAPRHAEELGDAGVPAWGDDFGAPHEALLSRLNEKPVFITHYPSAIKAFYMQPDPNRPEVALCADLLAPEGYGEIVGGSERIHDAALLESRIREHGLNVEDYQWYLDLRRYGSVPHSGFGVGIERLVTWISGIRHIRETIPFPRLLGKIYP